MTANAIDPSAVINPWRKIATPLRLHALQTCITWGLPMARKARKKSAAKAKKKPTAVSKKKRRTVTKKKSKAAARKKAARKTNPKPKPKGVVGTIVADIEAVVDTLTDAERLHRKLEPHVSREPE